MAVEKKILISKSRLKAVRKLSLFIEMLLEDNSRNFWKPTKLFAFKLYHAFPKDKFLKNKLRINWAFAIKKNEIIIFFFTTILLFYIRKRVI